MPSTNLNRVNVGMNKGQVTAVMGQPTRTSASPGVEYMIYHEPDNDSAHVFTFGAIPFREEADYYVRLVHGNVDAFGRVGDFNSTHPPEVKVDLDMIGSGSSPAFGQQPQAMAPVDRKLQIGMDALSRNDYQTAIKQLELATTDNPDSFQAWLALGISYAGVTNNPQSLYALKQATGIAPDRAEGWAALAYIYHRLGQTESYQDAMLKLRQLNPQLADQEVEVERKEAPPSAR